MKRILLIVSLFFAFCAAAQVENVIPARPNPPKLVNDLSGTLTPAQVEELEKKLVAYDDSTSTQIAIVLVKTLEGYDVGDYAFALGRKWGVGGKEFNNGIVVLAAIDDRKVRIEVGYGLEGAIPDVTARSIIDNEITPNFKAGNYYRGLDEATDAIIQAAAGKYKAPSGYGSKKKKGISWASIIFIIIFLLIAMGGNSRGGGTYVSRRGSRGLGGFPWWIGGLSGGGWSGGGGGGGGGGGFGGFGGGGFGGGGASGSW